MLPYIDLGVELTAAPGGGIDQVWGAVHYVQPGGSSLQSRGAYTSEHVHAELLKRDDPEDYKRRLESKGEIVFHSHRHAYSTQLVANMDLKSAQRLTRHPTTEFLAEIYGHSRASTAAEGVERSIKSPMRDPRQAPAQGAAQSGGE